MKSWKFLGISIFVIILSLQNMYAHFGVIIPSNDIVVPGKEKISLKVMFMHPFEQNYMNMQKPKYFGVVINNKKTELTNKLKEKKVKGCSVWEMKYTITQPGDHIFYFIPKPYWEPAEQCFIMHYTKVIVNAFGLEKGWDKEIGIKTEIVPLTRPYGIWAGNVFRGIVKLNGKPVPFCDVEIEYFNKNKKVSAPYDVFITQVIKTDKNGIFVYTIPWEGWWGFAALNEDSKKIKHSDGKEYPVEIGAVLWVKAYSVKSNRKTSKEKK